MLKSPSNKLLFHIIDNSGAISTVVLYDPVDRIMHNF